MVESNDYKERLEEARTKALDELMAKALPTMILECEFIRIMGPHFSPGREGATNNSQGAHSHNFESNPAHSHKFSRGSI